MSEWLPFLGLAGLIIGLFAWLRTDTHKQRRESLEQRKEFLEALDKQRKESLEQRKELLEALDKQREELLEALGKQREELLEAIQKLGGELHELRRQVLDIDKRLARVEGAIEFAFRLQGKDYPPGVGPVAQEARRIADADDPPPGPAREA